MSQSNRRIQKITIRNRDGAEDKLSVGANMQVLLDGEPIRGATFVKFEVHSKKVAKVTIELYAEVEIDANVFEPQVIKVKETNSRTLDGKALARHTLSSYEPVAIDIKKK